MPPTKKPQYNLDPAIFKKMNRGIGRGLCGVIYADPGIGKTHLASTLDPLTTLILNTDAGIGPILGKEHTVVTLSDNLEKLDWIYNFLRTEPHPFKNVVVDNLSELQKRMVNVLTEGRKKDFPELHEYGNASYKLREYIRLFRDLVEKNINVVFNCWEQNFQIKNAGGEVISKTGPDVFDKVMPELCGIVDFVGRLEFYEKTGDRWVRFTPQKNLIAKCQFQGLEACEPADLQEIFGKIYAHNYSTVAGAVATAAEMMKQEE